MKRRLCAATQAAMLLLAGFSHAGSGAPAEQLAPGRAIGLEETWEVELEGTILDVRRYSPRSPLELRIEEAAPVEGGYRYRLAYTAMEPGQHNLATLLERRGASATEELPALIVETDSLLPSDQIVGVKPVMIDDELNLGGYKNTMVFLAAGWLVGLLVFVFAGRKRVRRAVVVPGNPGLTAADLLQPLVLRAAEGTIDEHGKAQLERLFIAFWREKLVLRGIPMTEVMSSLRKHKVASELMTCLTEWLHRPPSHKSAIDVTSLMAPYRDKSAPGIQSAVTGDREGN